MKTAPAITAATIITATAATITAAIITMAATIITAVTIIMAAAIITMAAAITTTVAITTAAIIITTVVITTMVPAVPTAETDHMTTATDRREVMDVAHRQATHRDLIRATETAVQDRMAQAARHIRTARGLQTALVLGIDLTIIMHEVRVQMAGRTIDSANLARDKDSLRKLRQKIQRKSAKN